MMSEFWEYIVNLSIKYNWLIMITSIIGVWKFILKLRDRKEQKKEKKKAHLKGLQPSFEIQGQLANGNEWSFNLINKGDNAYDVELIDDKGEFDLVSIKRVIKTGNGISELKGKAVNRVKESAQIPAYTAYLHYKDKEGYSYQQKISREKGEKSFDIDQPNLIK